MSAPFHYNQAMLVDALRWLGVESGDVLFSHSNIGFLGIPEGERSQVNTMSTILTAFQNVLGPTGTLIVPTFTYSFSKGKSFDPVSTTSDCGAFTEWLRHHPGAFRSHEPNISVAAVGAQAEELTKDVPQNAYGEDSFFARFHRKGGKICNINFDAGSTFLHYVERCLQVPYRFDKTFSGNFINGGKDEQRKSTIWVRHLVEGTAARFEPFDKLARNKNLFRTKNVGRGFLGLITSQDCFRLLEDTLPFRPWLLTEAGITGLVPELPAAV